MKKLVVLMMFLIIGIPAFAQNYTVKRVIDGDTLELTTGERVRLIGIDCPEQA